jgi:hypothetical protein
MSALQLSRLFPSDSPATLPTPGIDSSVNYSILVRKCAESGVRTSADLFRLTELQVSGLIDVSVEDAKVHTIFLASDFQFEL